MTFTIYALRIAGDTEARYIGQTGYEPAIRLRRLRYEATLGTCSTQFRTWLNTYAGAIEAVAINHASSRHEARAKEREAIRLFGSFGHRLFNRQLVEASARLEPWNRAA